MRRPHVLVLQHDRLATLGWLGEVLEDACVAVEIVDVPGGTPLPDVADAAAVVSLGGDMAAYDDAGHPWLAPERALLADAVERGVPVLGICLGAQILASATGGRARPAQAPEIGFEALSLTAAGRKDPVLRHLDDTPLLLWHRDTFDLPAAACLLATSRRCPQAFRIGSGLGMQFHPETSPAMLEGWVESLGRDRADAPDTVFAALVPEALAIGDRLQTSAMRLLRAWLADAGLA